MLMKVFNKGQIVIPAPIRREFGISIGDNLEVKIEKDGIFIRKPVYKAKKLAGSFHKYAKNVPFPTEKEIQNAFSEAIIERYEKKNS